MGTFNYFKTREGIVIYGISPNKIPEDDPQRISVSEEEYNAVTAAIEAEIKAESERIAAEERAYVENLEKENAALLFQILTGEEYADV